MLFCYKFIILQVIFTTEFLAYKLEWAFRLMLTHTVVFCIHTCWFFFTSIMCINIALSYYVISIIFICMKDTWHELMLHIFSGSRNVVKVCSGVTAAVL